VGLTAAKGLAEATGRKMVAISNLQALASFGTKPLRAPVIDARRGDIFGAVYDADLRLVCDEVVMKYEDWVRTLPEGVELITHTPRLLAGAIARIAAGRFAAGSAQDPAEVDANYVRRSDAELMWRDKV
jgi:tRNA threonylcarbamoyladenosine biosynthesis protein TsaB